eukprot:9526902-Ditylum_brightwellii.AAC.1
MASNKTSGSCYYHQVHIYAGLRTLLVYNCKAANKCTLLVYDCKTANNGWKSLLSSSAQLRQTVYLASL